MTMAFAMQKPEGLSEEKYCTLILEMERLRIDAEMQKARIAAETEKARIAAETERIRERIAEKSRENIRLAEIASNERTAGLIIEVYFISLK